MIAEPMTTLTDYMLAALAAWLVVRLLRGSTASRARTLLAASFLSIGIAALVGGTLHGFLPYLGDATGTLLWKLTVLAIGASAFLFVAASAYASLRATPRRILLAIGMVQLAAYAAWMVRHDDFVWVIVNYVPQMVVVLALQSVRMWRGAAGAGWLISGLLLTLTGAAIQASGFALHRHFNHNDLYHVVQMAGLVLLYRGGQVIRDH
jgi:hypothetical protein